MERYSSNRRARALSNKQVLSSGTAELGTQAIRSELQASPRRYEPSNYYKAKSTSDSPSLASVSKGGITE